MKSINAKRIAAVAASLLMGLAFAGTGGVTWSNIPIISNSGQPVVQVVVGSTAMPSDGVVAANIAAVLGNLAFTSQGVTATPSGLSNVHCVVTTPTCTLTNQQVWFNEKGTFSGPSGSFSFTALIGSVLNQGVAGALGSPSNTKAPYVGTSYAFEVYSSALPVPTSATASPWSSLTSPPNPPNGFPSASNGGGLAYSTLRVPSTGTQYDNLIQVTPTQLPALLNNYGPGGETENLWITGIPVYDQRSASNPTTPNFAVYDVGGAYTINFNKPITNPIVQSGNSINNAAIRLLGQNWTILGYQYPTGGGVGGVKTVGTGDEVSGGMLQLAASLTSAQTVYVGHNITSGPWSVELTDLGQPNAGVSPAAVEVFYNGNWTNTTQINPGKLTTKFQVGKHTVYVKVNQTFAGLYAYQKWAKMQLYSNAVNVSGAGQVFNNTNAPGWRAYIFWSNSSGAAGATVNQLQGIEVYNYSPTTLIPGGSFTFVAPNYTAYKFNFVGDTLGTNFDPLQFSTASNGAIKFSNSLGATLQYISEPYQSLTVKSQITNAFSGVGGQPSSTVTYDLTPYALNPGALDNAAAATYSSFNGPYPVNVVVEATDFDGNLITSQNYLTVTLQGYTANTAGQSPSTATVYIKSLQPVSGIPVGWNVTSPTAVSQWSGASAFYNITNVTLSTALPGVSVYVVGQPSGTTSWKGAGGVATVAAVTANSLAYLTTQSPEAMYESSGNNYYQFSATSQVGYNQWNGQTVTPTGGFSVASTPPSSPTSQTVYQYFTYNMVEYNVPGSQSFEDALQFGIYNNTNGPGSSFGFELNRTSGQNRNNLTYYSSNVLGDLSGTAASTSVAAPVGFVTERGSKVAVITPSSLTVDLAKAVDTLQFVVSPQSVVVNSTTTSSSIGPVGVGQSVPGFSNLTVSEVNATCAFGATSCSVSGLANVTATPSVTSAVVPVPLNTAATPLVVLDSNANSAATLIVVGSKYVNSVAGQIFAQNPTLNSSFGPTSVVVQAYGTNRVLVAGYTANQTVQAGNQFIADLLSSASTP
jgi:hypothetical protein